MEIVFQIFLILLLVFLNGFFVASEFALVAVRKTRIEELSRKGSSSAKQVKMALEDLDSYISATQLGITLASLALGWSGEPFLAHIIEPFLGFLPKDAAFITSHTLAITIAFMIITFLHIVLGELAPKSIALQRSEKTALFIVTPLIIFTKLFKPFIWFLNGSGGLVLKLVGLTAPTGHQLVHSEEEIKMILSQSALEGAIPATEAEMMYKVFKLGENPVRQIMIPRTEIISFNVAQTLKEIEKKARIKSFSRFPVYENSIDDIVGFIHIKDIYKQLLQNKSDLKISQTNSIRKIISIPETKIADDVLKQMRKKRLHMAVVKDEFGGTAGIVTLEDIIESLVGEIEDEFETPLKNIERQSDGSYLIDGLTPIDQLQDKFRLPLKGQGYITIGGLIFGLLGRDPRKSDVIQLGNITLEIEKVEKKRVKTLRLRKKRKTAI